MAFIRHKYQHCKNNSKGNQIHQSPYYHSFYIIHAASQIGMISTENGYRNIVADHIIGSNKQKDNGKQRDYNLTLKFADCSGIFTFPQITRYKKREKYHDSGCRQKCTEFCPGSCPQCKNNAKRYNKPNSAKCLNGQTVCKQCQYIPHNRSGRP